MDYVNTFRYRGSDVRLYAGRDALDNLKSEAERAKAAKVFVVCVPEVARGSDLLARIGQALGERYAGAFDGVQASSPLPSVLAGARAARQAGADMLVALGGGSAVVTARAISIILAEGEDVHALCTQYPPGKQPVSPRLAKSKLPIVNALTTPTTAMNRAGAAVLDPGSSHRLELFDPKTRPVAIILDAQALLTAPVSLARGTGVASLADAIMSVAAMPPNPLGDGDAAQALRLAWDNLPRLVREPDNADARVLLATAAFLCNRSEDAQGGGSGQFGVVRSLAHCLASRHPRVGHGGAYAIVTVPCLRFNLAETVAGQARLAEALGARTKGMSDEGAALAAHAAIEGLLRGVGMPLRLSEVGVPREACDAVAADAMTDFFLFRNARKIRDAGELAEVLRGAW